MHKSFTILLLAALLFTACSPLRRAQRNRKADSTVVDRSDIRKVVTDILRESGTFTQTVVEFYPPVIVPPTDELPATDDEAPRPNRDEVFPEPPVIRSSPVRRIVKTEIAAESERTTTTDSLAHNDVRSNIRSELSDKVDEKPPSSLQAVKWIAAGPVALLLIILTLKFSKIKIPLSKLWRSRD